MPDIRAVRSDAKDDELPLLNSEIDFTYEDQTGDDVSVQSEDSADNREREYDAADERERHRKRREPDEEGVYFDDPLWYGKTEEQIAYATELEKSNGNAASRDGDWKRANRYWKNALKGAEKMKDAELQVRLRLNLALGYVRLQKTDKAHEHVDEILREHLRCAATSSMLAKAHYRRAEAYEGAGEESKARRSLRSCLDLEPTNADARKKLANLKSAELERRERERQLFGNKFHVPEAPSAPTNGYVVDKAAAVYSSEGAATSSTSSAPKDSQEAVSTAAKASQDALEKEVRDEVWDEDRRIVNSLTDRKASARLGAMLSGSARPGPQPSGESKLNCRMGPVYAFGPISARPEEAGGGVIDCEDDDDDGDDGDDEKKEASPISIEQWKKEVVVQAAAADEAAGIKKL